MAEMDYKGHKITVTPEFKFRVTGPEFDETASRHFEFASKDEATKAIDTRVNAADKQKKAEASIKLSALYGPGAELFEIRGINRSTSAILGCPQRGYGPQQINDIYPDVPWVKALLEEHKRLLGRIGEIVETLKPYGVRDQADYGGRVSPESYDKKLQNFVDDFNKKKAAAEAAAPTE